MDGLLLVDKPAGMTSAEVVRIVKRRLRVKTGHLGTLDPFATGVLPLCLGEATKIAQFLNAADKCYSGRIRLGTTTDSGDGTGAVTATASVPALSEDAVAAVARSFVGTLQQVPPMYSALKRSGTPLYKLARQGIAVEREPREVVISELKLRIVDFEALDIEVHCSKGTYVRVLAEDLAKALGTLGHLESLRRTQFGPFPLTQAIQLGDVDASVEPVSMRAALGGLSEISLSAEQVRQARHGFTPMLQHLPQGGTGELAKLIAPDGNLVAIVGMRDGWEFVRVFDTEPSAA